ncbi:hypothetical protein BGZ46_004327, partial [Entomortierella lignicola]
MQTKFVQKAQGLGLLDKGRGKGEIRVIMKYPASQLLRSAASQLTVELKKIYRNRTKDLHETLVRQKAKGILPESCNINIQRNKSAIENFVELNRTSSAGRRLAPISSVQSSFLIFSEYDLVNLFWHSGNENLRKKLRELDDERKGEDFHVACADLLDILSRSPAGTLITLLLSPVGRPIAERKGSRGYKDKTVLLSIQDMRTHLANIYQENFDPRSYTGSGYALFGSLRTDGLRLQLLAFKLKELQSIRYRRYPEGVLPSRITSTTGGLDYYLTEIRNVVKTKEDVQAIWGDCDPEKIKILGLDLGQAYVVGASALLPNTKVVKSDKAGPSKIHTSSTTFHNLTVNQKAVYQPTLKLRRWLEGRKRVVAPGTERSISDIESSLPPLRGEGASAERYFEEFTKRQWDAKKAREAEYRTITNRLLKMVGG